MMIVFRTARTQQQHQQFEPKQNMNTNRRDQMLVGSNEKEGRMVFGDGLCSNDGTISMKRWCSKSSPIQLEPKQQRRSLVSAG